MYVKSNPFNRYSVDDKYHLSYVYTPVTCKYVYMTKNIFEYDAGLIAAKMTVSEERLYTFLSRLFIFEP